MIPIYVLERPPGSHTLICNRIIFIEFNPELYMCKTMKTQESVSTKLINRSVLFLFFHTGAISDERLLIVITQHDLRYNAFNAELELNVADVKMHVQKVLGQQLNILDIENFAIPVSGQWALLANDVQILPNRAGIARKAQEVYEMLQEESNSEVRDEDVVQTLKSASNICKLEARFEH